MAASVQVLLLALAALVAAASPAGPLLLSMGNITASTIAAAATPTANNDTSPDDPDAVDASLAAYSAEEVEACRRRWHEVTMGADILDLNILPVLLDHGGFPGQMQGIKWQRNATAASPDLWTYDYVNTDNKTFLRVERGDIITRDPPVKGVVPVNVSGDIFWTPPDFCGKVRHAKYTQVPDSPQCLDLPIERGFCHLTTPTKAIYAIGKFDNGTASLCMEPGCSDKADHRISIALQAALVG